MKGATQSTPELYGRELGDHNFALVVDFYRTHPGCTRCECANFLGLSVYSVGRHVDRIRAAWLPIPVG
jgi:hypothetical protein